MRRLCITALLAFLPAIATADDCTVAPNVLGTVEHYYSSNKAKRSWSTPERGCNWYRVLLAFGEDLSDNACSDHFAMTAADAQSRVANWRGWQPIAHELKRLEVCHANNVKPEPEPQPDPQPEPGSEPGPETVTPTQSTGDVLSDLLLYGTVEDAIQHLPTIYFTNNVLVFRSEAPSNQHVSHENPRVIAYGWDAETILTWVTSESHPNYNQIEFLKLNGAKWDAGMVTYENGVASMSSMTSCTSCHGDMNKPLFGAVDIFAGTEQDMTRGRSSVNGSSATALAALGDLSKSTDPRLSQLNLKHHQVASKSGNNARRSYHGNGVASDAAYHMLWRQVEAVYEKQVAEHGEDVVLNDDRYCSGQMSGVIDHLPQGRENRHQLTNIAKFADGSLMNEVPKYVGDCVSSYVCFEDSFYVFTLKKLAEKNNRVAAVLNVARKARDDRVVEYSGIRGDWVRPIDELNHVFDRSFLRGEESLKARGQQHYRHGVGTSLALGGLVKEAFDEAGFCSCNLSHAGKCYDYTFSVQ